MFTANQLLLLAASADGYEHPALKMRTIISNAMLKNASVEPTVEQLAEVCRLWDEALDLRREVPGQVGDKRLTIGQVKTILSFSKNAAITLALNDIDDTEAQAQVMDALSAFVLGCNWPTYGDRVDIKVFLALLRHQFNQLDFS